MEPSHADHGKKPDPEDDEGNVESAPEAAPTKHDEVMPGWKREELEEAQPIPLPEIDDDDG